MINRRNTVDHHQTLCSQRDRNNSLLLPHLFLLFLNHPMIKILLLCLTPCRHYLSFLIQQKERAVFLVLRYHGRKFYRINSKVRNANLCQVALIRHILDQFSEHHGFPTVPHGTNPLRHHCTLAHVLNETWILLHKSVQIQMIFVHHGAGISVLCNDINTGYGISSSENSTYHLIHILHGPPPCTV